MAAQLRSTIGVGSAQKHKLGLKQGLASPEAALHYIKLAPAKGRLPLSSMRKREENLSAG